MKFLCIACDQAMRLSGTAGPDEGSLTVTFACPSCGHRVAMLTNPWETQMVRTLGVKVGGAPAEAPAPFAAVRASLAHQRDTGPAPAMPAHAEASAATDAPATDGPECPFAPMARQAIERFAQERGYATVTDEVMDQARDFMGM